MLEGRPALQRQGSRKKKEGGLRLPCFFSVCFLSLSSSLLNHYQPRIHGKYYWVHSYHGECIKKTVLFFPKKRQFYFSQEMLLNLELNNFGKKAQEEFFSIHSSCFILLSCTRKVMQYIARWKGNCCPFLVFLGFSQYSLVLGWVFERESRKHYWEVPAFTMSGVYNQVQLGSVHHPKSKSQRRAELGVKLSLDSKAFVYSTILSCLPAQGAGLSLISKRFSTLLIMNLQGIGSDPLDLHSKPELRCSYSQKILTNLGLYHQPAVLDIGCTSDPSEKNLKSWISGPHSQGIGMCSQDCKLLGMAM